MITVRVACKRAGASRLSAALVGLLMLSALTVLAQDEQRAEDDAPRTAGDSGLEQFQSGAKSARWYDCGCYDTPVKHYPYSVVVFEMPAHDLVVRPERHEGAFNFVPLAKRYGKRYCKLESEQDCYGEFSDPCDFTDHRYGPSLADYFPTCKSTQKEDE
jgi:hypothetical protein